MSPETSNRDIIHDIGAFILQWKYNCKSNCIAKSKWRKIIATKFLENKKFQDLKYRADKFSEAWDWLKKQNLIK